jgi:Fic family protein
VLFTVPPLPDQYPDVIAAIDDLRGKLRYRLASHPKRWMGVLRRQTFARAIQGSNSIEGYLVSNHDAVAAVENEPPLDTDTETWMAVSGYRAALSYVLQLADDPFYAHNEGTIRSLHFMMVGYDLSKHPGRWRPGAVYVRREATGEIVYEGPEVDLVPGLMRELVDSLNASSDLPVTVRAAMAHLNLAMIHPFSDGNGRMARALQTMVLSRDGILDPRFSTIEEYLGRHTLEYYAVLAEVGDGSWHPGRDCLPWLKFCLTAHYRQAETLLRRTNELARFWDEVEIELRRRRLHERMALALADAGFGYSVRNATYRTAAEVSDEVAGKDLRALVAAGMLEARGEKRGRHYVATGWLTALRQRCRETRYVTDPFDRSVARLAGPEQGFLPGLEPD